MERLRTVTRAGVRLSVREWGAGRQSFLLLHGLASSSHIWDLLVPHLGGFHVAAPDQRGHGESAKPRTGYGFDEIAADALAVSRALKMQRPVVVGHSWGGAVALEIAKRAPKRVAGAVLIDGGFIEMSSLMDWPTAREALAPPKLAGTRIEDFMSMVRSQPALKAMWSPAIETVILSLFTVRNGRITPKLSRANHMQILRAMFHQRSNDLLAQVAVPTLVLACRPKEPSPQEHGFLEAKKNASKGVRRIGAPVRFEWITGIHDVPLQRPAALARRLRAFASEVS